MADEQSWTVKIGDFGLATLKTIANEIRATKRSSGSSAGDSGVIVKQQSKSPAPPSPFRMPTGSILWMVSLIFVHVLELSNVLVQSIKSTFREKFNSSYVQCFFFALLGKLCVIVCQ